VFAGGLPGFEELHRFVLRSLGLDSPFQLMQSADSDVEFVMVPPHALFPQYEIELDDDSAAALGLEHPDDALVLAIVTLGDSLTTSTINLLGPIVANRATGVASQVILNGTGYSTKTPFPAL
jgi:flagellar assembly factor FliW